MDGDQTTDSNKTFSGTSTPGAVVTVDNGPAGKSTARADQTGHWQTQRYLVTGDNNLTITAVKAGFIDASPTIMTVTRNLTPAEQAAKSAADEAAFKNSVVNVSDADLLKDSSPFIGKAVSFRGQVFQIQQNGNAGGVMLLSVTDQGYGIWTDNIWVDYDTSTTANKNDIITVYGTVTGTKSYDTQAGGTTYVPQIHARYIDLTG